MRSILSLPFVPDLFVFLLHRRPGDFMGDLFLRFVAAALGGVFVFLEDAVEGLAQISYAWAGRLCFTLSGSSASVR